MRPVGGCAGRITNVLKGNEYFKNADNYKGTSIY